MTAEISLGFIFAIFFVTLGPLKLIPPFFMATQGLDQKARLGVAMKSTLLAAVILLATAVVALALLNNWRVSRETLVTTGGLLLLFGSLKSLSHGIPAAPEVDPAHAPPPAAAHRSPVISPITIPATITPWGLVALILFVGVAEDQHRLVGVFSMLLLMLALNFLGMAFAGPFMRLVGMPALSVLGWIFIILQAALGVTFLLRGLTAAFGVPWVPTPI